MNSKFNNIETIFFLLVDDEKKFIETMAQRLQRRGFKANCVFSGSEALNFLKKNDSVDVVILDLKMPGSDGIKTVEIIKKNHPLIEVIILTGHATVPSAVETLKFGAFDYLTKPCDLIDLIFKAKQAFSRKKEREAKILDARMKPYISEREREKLISDILNFKE